MSDAIAPPPSRELFLLLWPESRSDITTPLLTLTTDKAPNACPEHVTWWKPPRSSLQYPDEDEALGDVVQGTISAATLLQEDDIGPRTLARWDRSARWMLKSFGFESPDGQDRRNRCPALSKAIEHKSGIHERRPEDRATASAMLQPCSCVFRVAEGWVQAAQKSRLTAGRCRFCCGLFNQP
jgi:hypothetical protein